MNHKFWTPIPQNLNHQTDKKILQTEFIKTKTNKKRVIVAYDKYLVMIKAGKAVKYLSFTFDIKFEVLRKSIPKKDEEDDTLGPIIGLVLHRDVQDEKLSYQLTSSVENIKTWRDFLAPKINQWQFHHMFRVYKKIGKGNFATVYLAEKIEDGTQMAIKAFAKQAAYAEENGKEAIINEIQIMRKLNHHHIMKLYEVYETTNSLYVGLELLEGGSLYDIIKEKALLSIIQIQQILCGVLLGLHHMHAQNIMHRDLKLENILFKQPKKLDSVVVADFGLATNVNEKVYLYCRCGTPGYVAPEVINIKDMNSHYSSVCDIYSLGLVFYLLLSGKQAFPGKSYATVVRQNREATIDFGIKQLGGAPASAMDLLKKMLEKDPIKRITADQCLSHPFLFEQTQQMQDVSEHDFIEEPEEDNDISNRMAQLNDQSNYNGKFEQFRQNLYLNSPSNSPKVMDTRQLKQSKLIDSQNALKMQSPVITGKIDSVDSIGNFSLGQMQQKQQNNFQPSPKLKPSHFKQTTNNPLLKYAQSKKQQ